MIIKTKYIFIIFFLVLISYFVYLTIEKQKTLSWSPLPWIHYYTRNPDIPGGCIFNCEGYETELNCKHDFNIKSCNYKCNGKLYNSCINGF